MNRSRAALLVGAVVLGACNGEKAGAARVAADMNPVLAELRPSVTAIRAAKKEEPAVMAKQMAEPCAAMAAPLEKMAALKFAKKTSVETQAWAVGIAAGDVAKELRRACGTGRVVDLGVRAADCSLKCDEGLERLDEELIRHGPSECSDSRRCAPSAP